MKLHSTYRISEEGKELMRLLAQDLGVNQTSVLEIAIRDLAAKRGVRNKASGQVPSQKNDIY